MQTTQARDKPAADNRATKTGNLSTKKSSVQTHHDRKTQHKPAAKAIENDNSSEDDEYGSEDSEDDEYGSEDSEDDEYGSEDSEDDEYGSEDDISAKYNSDDDGDGDDDDDEAVDDTSRGPRKRTYSTAEFSEPLEVARKCKCKPAPEVVQELPTTWQIVANRKGKTVYFAVDSTKLSPEQHDLLTRKSVSLSDESMLGEFDRLFGAIAESSGVVVNGSNKYGTIKLRPAALVIFA